jgi:hypothetical protein
MQRHARSPVGYALPDRVAGRKQRPEADFFGSFRALRCAMMLWNVGVLLVLRKAASSMERGDDGPNAASKTASHPLLTQHSSLPHHDFHGEVLL